MPATAHTRFKRIWLTASINASLKYMAPSQYLSTRWEKEEEEEEEEQEQEEQESQRRQLQRQPILQPQLRPRPHFLRHLLASVF